MVMRPRRGQNYRDFTKSCVQRETLKPRGTALARKFLTREYRFMFPVIIRLCNTAYLPYTVCSQVLRCVISSNSRSWSQYLELVGLSSRLLNVLQTTVATD